MPAPDSIRALCETFRLHREHYTSGGYNETELRRLNSDIAITDRQIDRLVYELYALTP